MLAAGMGWDGMEWITLRGKHSPASMRLAQEGKEGDLDFTLCTSTVQAAAGGTRGSRPPARINQTSANGTQQLSMSIPTPGAGALPRGVGVSSRPSGGRGPCAACS
jgi:hypothetical protein